MTEPQPVHAQLGKYAILELIGEGATASVYHALDTYLKRDVALKILKPALIADPVAFARFAQEAQASASIFHSNIAAVIDMGEAQGRFFIVMQFIPGQSLDKYLRDNGPLAMEEVLRMASQIGEAMDFIHSKGFLHRDIKPSNIMRKPDGDYVLTDFGLLRAMMTTGLTSHTGAILGTPSYIAPEIWLDQPAAPTTDQYALACVVVEALTGKIAFTGDTPPAIMTAHVMKGTQVLESGAVPKMLVPVLRRALRKEPARRFPNMTSFAKALRAASQARPAAPPRPAERVVQGTGTAETPAQKPEPAVVPPVEGKIEPAVTAAAEPAVPEHPSAKPPSPVENSTAPGERENWRPLSPLPDLPVVEKKKPSQKRSLPWYWIAAGAIVLAVIAIKALFPGAPAAPAGPTPEMTPTRAFASNNPIATETPQFDVPSPEPAPFEQPAFSGELLSRSAETCDYGGEFRSIEAVDQYTVIFNLCYPDPAFASKITLSNFSIADSEHLNRYGGDSLAMSDDPNGTGPFMLEEWQRGEEIVFAANPNYWGGSPQYQNLILRWVNDPEQRLREIRSGGADGFDNPARDNYPSINSDPNLVLYPREPWNIFYLGFQVDHPPFNDERVRLAIAHGIDRQRIVEQYYPSGSQVADAFVPPATNPGSVTVQGWPNYDPEQARALLAEAGYPDGMEIPLYFRNVVRSYLPSPLPVAEDIQAQLAEIGINVVIEELDSIDFIEQMLSGQLSFYMSGWQADFPDALNYYDFHFTNESNYQFGTPFADIVEPLLSARQISSSDERRLLYDEANAAIRQHIPMIPVAHGSSATVFRSAVRDAGYGVYNSEPFYRMKPDHDALVFIQSLEPGALWCADETDFDTMRACQQIYEPLLSVGAYGSGLAEAFEVNEEATQWIFYLRQGVRFHNGAWLDANDVVASFTAQWDAADPNFKGRTSDFAYFGAFFGAHLNAPQQ